MPPTTPVVPVAAPFGLVAPKWPRAEPEPPPSPPHELPAGRDLLDQERVLVGDVDVGTGRPRGIGDPGRVVGDRLWEAEDARARVPIDLRGGELGRAGRTGGEAEGDRCRDQKPAHGPSVATPFAICGAMRAAFDHRVPGRWSQNGVTPPRPAVYPAITPAEPSSPACAA